MMRRPIPKFDRRLIGTWRSDRRRTLRYHKPPAACTPQQWKMFQSVFGKLVIRWGRSRVYTEMDGWRNASRYEIVARDSFSTVIRTWSEAFGENVLQQIYFDGDYYQVITLGGGMIEWFKRVK